MDLKQFRVIQSRSLAAPALPQPTISPSPHHVVADLCRLSGARRAGMDDVLAHRLEDRLAACESRIRPANHEGERGTLPPPPTPPETGRVPACRSAPRASSATVRASSRRSSSSRSATAFFQRAASPRRSGRPARSTRRHARPPTSYGDDDLRPTCRLPRARRLFAPGRAPRLHARRIKVEPRHVMPGAHQVGGHRATHVPRPMKAIVVMPVSAVSGGMSPIRPPRTSSRLARPGATA